MKLPNFFINQLIEKSFQSEDTTAAQLAHFWSANHNELWKISYKRSNDIQKTPYCFLLNLI